LWPFRLGEALRVRFADEIVKLLGKFTWLSFRTNSRQLIINFRAIPDELLSERLLVGRVVGR